MAAAAAGRAPEVPQNQAANSSTLQQDKQVAFVGSIASAALIGLGAVFSSTFRRAIPWVVVPSLLITGALKLFMEAVNKTNAQFKAPSSSVNNGKLVAFTLLSTKGVDLLSSALLSASLIAPSIATPVAALAIGIFQGFVSDRLHYKGTSHYYVRALNFLTATSSSVSMSWAFNAFGWQGAAAFTLTNITMPLGLLYYRASQES